MGFDTWYAFGTHLNEALLVELADAMVRHGFRGAGYRYLWLDAGWWSGVRDAAGNIVVSRRQWPHGMRWLTRYIHSRGLLAGIYTDAGDTGCAEPRAGSYGHYRGDADTFASWGFDAVKVDFCGGNAMQLSPRGAYRQFGRALAAVSPTRVMLFNVCDGAVPGQYGPGLPSYDRSAYAAYSFAPPSASSWRTGGDIGRPGRVVFTGVLRNLDHDAAHPEAARPGHWNDPDYLVPDAGLSPAEARAQFTMWAILGAPLMVSADVRRLTGQTRAMLMNQDAIAIDQDRLGIQGRMLTERGGLQVWVKPLDRGARAVAFLNRGHSVRSIRITLGSLGFRRTHRVRTEDVWSHHFVTTSAVIRERVAPRSALLLRLWPQ